LVVARVGFFEGAVAQITYFVPLGAVTGNRFQGNFGVFAHLFFLKLINQENLPGNGLIALDPEISEFAFIERDALGGATGQEQEGQEEKEVFCGHEAHLSA
jgi:hypothetical protein